MLFPQHTHLAPGLSLGLLLWPGPCSTLTPGVLQVEPSASQVAAAAAMLAALHLPHFYPGSIPNPHLQRHYAVLESFALGDQPGQTIPDETVPEEEDFDEMSTFIHAFKVSWGGV